ncbi:recombinase [Streptomyces sp. DSM 44915]|uniref:Recombinase n=1 Tax=Streptomyces chisholmiae TaxID=3075540 RepID=A0ABU2JWE4_9ACTN|nr:recombinase [Streptomyces sp. DSM 44915]MDT0269068.1 recombinase [Streptomyces sp. DSM 44915]
MPHGNPKMLGRLAELGTDLLVRLRRAEEKSWLGEAEGINLTLTFFRAKREETERQARRPAVVLGIPKLRQLRRASDEGHHHRFR